jgi:hypothetical protein
MHNLILSGYLGLEAGRPGSLEARKLGSWEARRLGSWEARRPGGWEAWKPEGQVAGKQGGKKVDRVLKIFRSFAFLASKHLCFWPHSFPAFSLPGSYFLFIIFSLSLKSSRVRLGPE